MRIRGVDLVLHPPGEGVSDGIRRSGDFYEAAILDYLRDNHPEQKVIVDAGANIGNHTLYFATFLNHVRIHAFEPIFENYSLLVENVRHIDTVATYEIALSNHVGVLNMQMNPANMGACLVTGEGETRVPAIPLDKFGLTDVTLLKMDVENHETQVIAGATATIVRNRPLVLIEDWPYGKGSDRLLGYELEMEWPEAFTYLYRYAG